MSSFVSCWSTMLSLTWWLSLCYAFEPSRPQVCVVVRTYSGHLEEPFSLQKLIESLVEQRHVVLEFVVVNTDSSPFPELPSILSNVKAKNTIVPWTAPEVFSYGDAGYAATDFAITFCSNSSEWLLVTNGDNRYDANLFFSYLNNPDFAGADIIGTDFHSRYRNWVNCGRRSKKMCRENRFQLAYTDLGANVMNLRKWKTEGIKYTEGVPQNGEQDGRIIEKLAQGSWVTKKMSGCSFSHTPNPVSCVSENMVWEPKGKKCLSFEKANEYKKVFPRSELVKESCLRIFVDDEKDYFDMSGITAEKEFKRAWRREQLMGEPIK